MYRKQAHANMQNSTESIVSSSVLSPAKRVSKDDDLSSKSSFDTGKAVKEVNVSNTQGQERIRASSERKVTFEGESQLQPPRKASDIVGGVPFIDTKKKESAIQKIFRILGIKQ